MVSIHVLFCHLKCRVVFWVLLLLLRRPSGKVCFCRVSRREDNGEIDNYVRVHAYLLSLFF